MLKRFFSLLLVLPASLFIQSVYAVDYVVTGSVKDLDGKYIYLFDYDKKENIDSARVENGSFRIEGNYYRDANVRVECGNVFSNCILDSLAIVDFITHFPSDGSYLNRRMRDIRNIENSKREHLGKFSQELKSHGFDEYEANEIYGKLYDKYRPEMISMYADIILDNPNGLGEFAISSLYPWSLTVEEWDSIYQNLPPRLKDTQNVSLLNDKYTNLRKTLPGMPFVDFSGKSVNGELVRLSDYVGKGKFVLVDFWASWCGPCQKEAKDVLIPLYERYKDNGNLEIIGVAVWDSHESSVKSIEKNQYPWKNIIDADTNPMELYGFDAIPMIILFSPEGKIIERGLRGKNIEKEVDSVL